MSSSNNASNTIITTERIHDIVRQVMRTALETQARPGTLFPTEAETTVPSFGPVHITQIVRKTITTATLPEGTVAITPNRQQVLITDCEGNTAVALTRNIDPAIAETLGIALPGAANRYRLIQEALANTSVEEEEEDEDDHDTILYGTPEPHLPITPFNSVDREVISDPEVDFDPNNLPELQESIRRRIMDALHVKEEEEKKTPTPTPSPEPLPVRPPLPRLVIPSNFDDLPLAQDAPPIPRTFGQRIPSPDPISIEQFMDLYRDLPACMELTNALGFRSDTIEQLDNLFDLMAIDEWISKYRSQTEKHHNTSRELMSELWDAQRQYEREWDRLTTALQAQWDHHAQLDHTAECARRLQDRVFGRIFTEERASFNTEALQAWKNLQARSNHEAEERQKSCKIEDVKPSSTVKPKPASWNASFFPAKNLTPKKTPSISPTPAPVNHTLRKKYESFKCELCENVGHIKWNCPWYQCEHCLVDGPGHKPENCPRPKAHVMRLRGGCATPDRMVCLTCTQEGHIRQDCDHYRCRYCHRRAPGHLSRNCPQRARHARLLLQARRRRQQRDLADRMEDPNNGQYDVYFDDNMDGEC